MALNQDEILRYSRHLIMPEVGVEGQEKLNPAYADASKWKAEFDAVTKLYADHYKTGPFK